MIRIGIGRKDIIMFEERIQALNEQTVATVQEPEPYSALKRTYTVGEIQDILGISQPTAYALVNKGLFHTIRVGGRIRVSKKSFDEWLDGCC